jgi:membrane protein
MSLRGFAAVIGTALQHCRRIGISHLAAAISYNSFLSLAPLLLLLLTISGRLLGGAEARPRVLESVERVAGPAAVPIVESLLEVVARTPTGAVSSTVGLALLIYFLSAVFYEVRRAINGIWEAGFRHSFGHVVYHRLLSFLMVPASVAIFLGTLLINLSASVLSPFITDLLPRGALLWRGVNVGFSLLLISFILAVAFRHGPTVRLRWRDVYGGALLTSVLFLAGNSLIGYFIRKSALASLYGAAGAVIAVMIWIYYVAMIVLFGAAYTRAYAERHGSRRGVSPG